MYLLTMLAYIHLHSHHFRPGGHVALHWFELVLLPLAGLAVYPDKVLLWTSRNANKIYGWRSLALVESAALGVLVIGANLLMRGHPDLVWWNPVVLVAFWVVLRVALIFVT